MRRLAGRFFGSRSGSFAPILILSMVPLVAAVGFSVDYTSAVQTRANNQAALDAGIISITTMSTASTLPQRQIVLQQSYDANGGQGTATLNSFVVATDGTATANAKANFAMPTIFMKIARIDTVPLYVASAVSKSPALVQATFKVTGVSGYWNKTMTLYGTQFSAAVAKPLMTISYNYGSTGDPKGYGTTIVNTITNVAGVDVPTMVQKQVCSLGNNPPNGVTVKTDKFGTRYYCVDTMYPSGGAGAAIDVSQMSGLYLKMNVPSGNPQNLLSNDPATSNRLYNSTDVNVAATEIPSGQIVDIFGIVPCGATGYQAWEDGGNPVPAPVSNADFFYNVTGKCAFNQRANETLITQ